MAEIPVFILFGATASGKTKLAETLWAGSGEVEVISADSMQVYRGMDIGTAKPEPSLLEKLPHHLIDIRDPSEHFCAGDFVREADLCCASVYSRGKIPVICGGTGFYIRNFLYGLPSTPQSNPETRKMLADRMKREGAAVLLGELAEIDPARAEKLNVHDEYRILRALEIFYDSGTAQSEFSLPEKTREGFRFAVVSLDRPRQELYDRIEERCRQMFSAGLEEETAALIRQGFGAGSPGMRAIGYREFFQEPGCAETLAAGNKLSAGQVEAVFRSIVRDSKRYAKRQETFIKPLPGIFHLQTDRMDEKETGKKLRDIFDGFVAGKQDEKVWDQQTE